MWHFTLLQMQKMSKKKKLLVIIEPGKDFDRIGRFILLHNFY